MRLKNTTTFAAAVALSSLYVTAGADEAARIALSIQAQPISEALMDLGEQAGLQVIVRREDIVSEGKLAPSVNGTLTVQAALELLLTDSGLTYEFLDPRTVRVSRPATGATWPLQHGALETWVAQANPGVGVGAHSAQERDQQSAADSLEEVIVTAQRRQEILQNVPISIAVLRGEEIDNVAAPGIRNVLRLVPGFDAMDMGNTSAYSLRGVSAAAGSGTLGFYMDGVPYGFARTAYYPDPNVYDLDRIEVLSGPQGTLYGANALNGVIRVLTQNANAEKFELKARTLFSKTEDGDQSTGGNVAVNVPIVDGRLGARFVAGFANLGGWVDSPLGRDINSVDSVDYRLKLHGAPSDTLTVDLTVWREELDRRREGLSFDDRTSNMTHPEPQYSEFMTYGLNVAKQFSNFSITSQTSYIDYTTEATADGTAVGFPALLFSVSDSTVFSQEFNVISALDGRWEWTTGAFYREAKDRNHGTFEFPIGRGPVPNADFGDRSESYALFGEVSRDIGDFNLAAGLRYFHDDETMTTGIAYPGSLPVPAGASFETPSEAVTPRVVLTWAPREDLTSYVSFSQGFRSGFTQAPATQAEFPNLAGVDPDRLSNYEIGAKGKAFNGRLNYETAIFYVDWQDPQQSLRVLITSGPSQGLLTGAIVNGGSVSGIGASFAITAEPVHGLQLGLNAGWNDLGFDADLRDAGNAVIFAKGDRPDLSPEWTAGASIEYSWSLGGDYRTTSALSATYKSPQNTTTLLVGSAESDSILITDARLSITAPKNWTLSLFADNLGDEDGRIWEYSPAPEWIRHPRPRTVGLQLEYRY